MMEKARREGMRWQLLNVLHKAMPYTTNEQFLLDVMRGKLVELTKQPHGVWFADINRLGVDIVEYTIDCQAGIARPEKYWA